MRGVLIAALIVLLVGTGYWGYQEHKEKNAILINAENNYQRAFHELTYNIDILHDKIGTALAMNSRKSLSPALAEVWRMTSQANSEVGQLPLTLAPFSKTEEFLSQIGDFTYKTAVRDLEKEPLSDEEYQMLKSLYQKSAEIQDELRKVQYLVLNNRLRWMDVETALATGKGNTDNSIIDGFKTVEEKVSGYSETDLGQFLSSSIKKKEKGYKNLKGKTISKKEAAAIAKKYAKASGGAKVNVTEGGKGSDYAFYSVTVKDRSGETDMDITKKGGYPIWLIKNRDVKEQKISLNEAGNKAAEFLQKNGFENMEMLESAQYDHVGVFTFVAREKNVRVYPDAVKIKIGLDDGSLIGFSAEEYLASHNTREIPEPAVQEAEARKRLNPNLKVMDQRLAIIHNDANEEVLCYEYLGVLGDDTYRVFVNAEDGTEEKVEKLQNAEPIYENLINGRA